jgi:hypothetical protein
MRKISKPKVGRMVMRRAYKITEADRQRFLVEHSSATAVTGPLETHCLEWANNNFGKGYGCFSLGGSSMSAHRMAWSVFRGDIPPRLCVLHRCDNRVCVNIDHLFLGTHQDNEDDKVSKGRHAFGERNSQAALTDDVVLQIYEMAHDCIYTQRDIGWMFGVSRELVSQIKLRKIWKHLWRRPEWTTPKIGELRPYAANVIQRRVFT